MTSAGRQDSDRTAGGDSQVGWQHVVAVVAAAAGGAAWVSAVGSAVVGLRLANASLPVESVVALMSAEHRFAIGAGYLIAPLFVGLVGFLVDWLIIRREDAASGIPEAATSATTEARKWWRPRQWWRSASGREKAALPTIVVASALGFFLLDPPVRGVFIFQCAALLVVVLIVIAIHSHRPTEHHRIDERVAVFVSVLVSAGAIALCYEQLFADATFDTAQIRLQGEGGTVEGGYVTTTDTAVLLIARDSDDCPAITAVRRDQIQQVWVDPSDVEVDVDAGVCGQEQPWREITVDDR